MKPNKSPGPRSGRIQFPIGLIAGRKWLAFLRRSLVVRAFITASLVFIAVSSQAMSPDYDSSRHDVELHNPKDKTWKAARLFVVASTNNIILRFHTGITIREIIDATPLKGTKVTVYILREGADPKDVPVFDETVRPLDAPKFLVKPHDLLFIYLDDIMPRW